MPGTLSFWATILNSAGCLVDSIDTCIDPPLVSVYMPTHNRENMVLGAVQSVLGQTYKNIELVVCIDGSRDATAAILAEVSQEDPRLRIIENSVTSGANVARNRALSECHGEFVTGLDDDDRMTPDRIQNFVDFWRNNPRYSFLYTPYTRQWGLKKRILGRRSTDFRQLLFTNCVGNQVFTVRQRMSEVGGYDENLPMWQDYELWLRLVRKYGIAHRVWPPSYVLDQSHSQARISDAKVEKAEATHRYIAEKLELSEKEAFLMSFGLAQYGKNFTVVELIRFALNGHPYRPLRKMITSGRR